MIKIMYVSHSAELAGAEQSLLDILRYIRDAVVPIVILPRNGVIVNMLNNLDVKYYIYDYPLTYNRIGHKNSEMSAKDFVRTYHTAIEIANLIREEKVDLIHTNSTVVDVGAIAASIADKPHIWHFRELMEEDFNLEYYDKELKTLFFRNAVKCISISECVYQKYLGTYNIKSIKINNGIDNERFYQEIGGKSLNNTNFYIVGRLSKNKGQLDAIKAVDILVKEGYTDLKLYIKGNLSYQVKWSLHKYINRKGLGEYIQLSDFSYSLDQLRRDCICSITTSKMEALGRVTIEAMLAGNIVIGADTGGTAEIIGSNQENGYLYKQGNAQDLAEKMKAVMELSQEQKLEMIKKVQKYAQNRFHILEYTKKLVDIYEMAIREYMQDDKVKNTIIKYFQEEENIVAKTGFVYTILEKMKEKKYIQYLKRRHIVHLAVYGIGNIGIELLDNLENTDISVDYVIDKSENMMFLNYDYYEPNDTLPLTQAIIITVKDGVKIKEFYRSKYDYEIICIEELVD